MRTSKQGAVRLVRETGKPIAQVARELGILEGTLGNWCAQDRRLRSLHRFATKAQARARVAAWIDEYNRDRKHSSIGMQTPINYEIVSRTGNRTAAA